MLLYRFTVCKELKKITIVWEKFAVKKFSSVACWDENLTHEIFLPLNKYENILPKKVKIF